MKRRIIKICLLLLLSGVGLSGIKVNEKDTNEFSQSNNVHQIEIKEKNDDLKNNEDIKDEETDDSDEFSDTVKRTEQDENDSSFSKKTKDKKSIKKESVNPIEISNNQQKEESNREQIQSQYTSNNTTSEKENSNNDKESANSNVEKHYDYDIGNCGKLYNSEDEAYAAAESCYNDFSDPYKYVSSYFIYSTYDKWSFSLYYSYY